MYASVHVPKKDQINILSLATRSKDEFVKEYRKYNKTKAREVYLQALIELKRTILEGNVKKLKSLSNAIEYINSVEDRATLKDFYDNANNPIKCTNLVILACKENKVEILQLLFDNFSNILKNLSNDIGRTAILPADEDETCHNAFYYAIHSGNVELLHTIINWPDDYFNFHLEELDEILSKAYDELKLKNVPFSNKIEIFVQYKLINLRFFSYNFEQYKTLKVDLNNIRERIALVLHNIGLLETQYSNLGKVDEKFLFIAKFIAHNIHILKRQLKSTYVRLPWEEIEFCLVSFVSSYMKQQEINLFYHATLNKSKILNHLKKFANKLKEEINTIVSTNIKKLAKLPISKTREKVVVEIINNYPQFKELYNDYQQIRDACSLEKISNSVKLALSACPEEREGQLIITRVLQIIGEYLKNTLESPKLSNSASELFLFSLPKNTRKVIIDLRNSLSHVDSLSKQTENEENTDIDFFKGVQSDINKVGDVITDILYNMKIKMIRMLLRKFINCENLDEINELATGFSYAELDYTSSRSFKTMGHEKLEKLIRELNKNILHKTDYEKKLFKKVDNLISSIKAEPQGIIDNYIFGFAIFKALITSFSNNKNDHNFIRVMKFRANKTLQSIAPKIQSHSLKDVVKLIMEITHSVCLRMQCDDLDEIYRIATETIYIAEFETEDIKWIEELKDKLVGKCSLIPEHKQCKTYIAAAEENYNGQLLLKLSELKGILNKNSLSSQSIEELSLYKTDKKSQAVVEMLVLDIMSMLGEIKHCLENDLYFLDDNTPLLTGKCLRNYLSHNDALVDVVLPDSLIAIILNAIKLTEENVMKSKKKIGKFLNDDPVKLREKYSQGLVTITYQEKMFIALEEGNFESLKDCLIKGADINARNINSSTTLHFAAKGPSFEVLKFIFDQYSNINVKDVCGQNPLHFAAAYGKYRNVEFFLQTGLYVDEADYHGKTSLHIAAQNGHKETVEILLKNKAKTFVKDNNGCSPIHHAINNNHVDVVKILIDKDANVDINEAVGGFTPLHEAAESGHLELVNFLLQNKAHVNSKNDRNWTPLHAAALNGHLEVVNALILKGANVSARIIDGCAPLHYAVENGHEEIANILLSHGADVNVVDNIYNNTPLHYASTDGHLGIVKALLKHKADAHKTTTEGITPLHLAALYGHLEIVTFLLNHSINVHAKDKRNTTPLHYAANGGHKEIAELLIKNGAAIDAETDDDFTPLCMAVLNSHKDMINFLIKNKARVNVLNIKATTPLHVAAMQNSKDVIDILIKNNAEVNIRMKEGLTPLHVATVNDATDAIGFLIQNGAEINTRDNLGYTPLHTSILVGHKNIVEILIANGADVNAICNNDTPLFSAIKCNNKEIVEILIVKGGYNVKPADRMYLPFAVSAGYKDIVRILLKNNAHVNMKYDENATLLHLAAKRGHKEIVTDLLKKGANVDAITINNATPLFFAAHGGHEKVADILLTYKASANVKSIEGITPLHIAARYGYSNVVKVLLQKGANVKIKDDKNRTPLELAVGHGHLQVVKMLMQHKKVDINAKCNDDDFTLLHIAAQENKNLQIIEYLINEGSDINAKNVSGSKPIHIAAREGFKEAVDFLLSKGSSINDLGIANQNLLHYAAMGNHLQVIKYLIAHGVNVNAKDANGVTPMHIAASFGYKDTIEILLQNGAVYDAVDKFNRKPLDITFNKDIISLLASTKHLFDTVKHNCPLDVENCLKEGAFVNAITFDNVTPLLYAAWKGYDRIVNILLQNKANPNVGGKKGVTPLHYAAKFSHLKVVMALLSSGAVYNAISDNGKTPLDFAVDKDIISLLELVSESFENIKNDNSKVLNDLDKIKDINTIKAIMRAFNVEHKTLIVTAMQNKFSKVEQLKQILHDDVSAEIKKALMLLDQNDYQRALRIFKTILTKRKEILGPDSPGILDIQTYIAKVFYKQGAYQKALNILQEIFQKQKELLGVNDVNTLNTWSMFALVLHRQGQNDEAFNICQEVYQRQKDLLGENHSDVLDTQFQMALVLDKQKKYEEALDINRSVFEKWKKNSGMNHPKTVRAQNNIAMVLANQGKYKESRKIYREVYERKKMVFGVNHSDTLRTLHNIAGVFSLEKKYHEALKSLQEILDIQNIVLGSNHPDTLNTQQNLANVLFAQGKYVSALKAFRKVFDQAKAVLGPSHPHVLDSSKKIEMINMMFKRDGRETLEMFQHLQVNLNIAAQNGDIQTVERLLKDGADVNDKDINGRTPLHFAVSSGKASVVSILLENGVDVTQTTNKGNTPLHTATSIGNIEIVEVLLQHVPHNVSNDFINAKTIADGTTSLHVAAKKSFLEIVKSLLKYGATYDIKNKENKKPLDLSSHESVINLLKLIEELFEDAKKGNIEIINKLQALKSDVFLAVTNACNKEANTLLQITVVYKHKYIAGKLLEMLQK